MNTKLHIDFCSNEAATYACKNWHYSKSVPAAGKVKFGVWEDDKYIGVVIYSNGASPHLLTRYNLKHTEGCELTKIALRDHINPVSKMISITLRLLKKHCPGLKLVVSFADTNEGHHGGIYQATNWIYTGKSKGACFYKYGDRIYHPRAACSNKYKIKPKHFCEKVWKEGKHRYLMPLTKEMRKQVIHLQLPYPKKEAVEAGDDCDQQNSGGATPTQPLQKGIYLFSSITKAAQALCLKQPTISERLKDHKDCYLMGVKQ